MACKATALATELYPQAWPPLRRDSRHYESTDSLCTGCGIIREYSFDEYVDTEKGGEFERERASPRTRSRLSHRPLRWLAASCRSCTVRGFAEANRCSLRKEVIQPHLPVRLPCYDFTPLTRHTFGSAPLAVRLLTSGTPNSGGVTGGVYKARERIHRAMLMRDY